MSDYAHLLESLRGGGLVIAQSAVAVPLTTVTTKTTLATITVPPGMMGSNGRVEIDVFWTNVNSADDKTLAIELNAAGGLNSLATTGVIHRTLFVISNRNATNVQHVYRTESSVAAVVPSATTDAEDTTAALVITICGTLEAGADTMTMEAYSARVIQR